MLLRAAAVALLGVAAWVYVTAWGDLRADLGSARARQQLDNWLSGDTRSLQRPALEEVQADLQRALQIQPQNPNLHENLGDLLVLGAQQPWADATLRTQQLKQAVTHYRETLAIRPRDGRTWAALSVALALQGAHGPELHHAWKQTRLLGPREGYLLRYQAFAVLTGWDQASPEMQQWATDLYEKGTAAQREAINRFAAPYGLQFASDQPPRR